MTNMKNNNELEEREKPQFRKIFFDSFDKEDEKKGSKGRKKTRKTKYKMSSVFFNGCLPDIFNDLLKKTLQFTL